MAIVFDLIAATGLLAIALYGALLLWRNWQESRMASAYHGQEMQLLDRQIDRQIDLARAESSRVRDAWEGFRKFELRGKVLEADGVCSFYFTPHDGKPLPSFQPGQYLTFKINLPERDKPLVRCYSLSDSPNHPDYYRVTVKRALAPKGKPAIPDGLSSTFFHHLLNPDDIIDIKAPSGHFYLDLEHHSPVVLIGGGIGVTPVLSMLNAVTASGSTREVWFFYGVRDSAEVIMQDHFREIAREFPNIHVNLCFSNPGSHDRPGIDYQHGERISVELFKRLLPSNNYDYYICGPAPLMDSVTSDLYNWGVPKNKVHFEAFGPATVKSVRDEQRQPTVGDQKTVRIHLKRSNKEITWMASSGSILECVEAAGVNLDSGCRAGNCGACQIALLDGEVSYLSEPGAPVEKGSCLICVSVPTGNLVIDA